MEENENLNISESEKNANIEVKKQISETDNKTVSGFAITSLVLGIVSLLLCCCSVYISIPCAVLAIVFAIIAKKQHGPSGMATAGLVLGIISAALLVMLFILIGTGITISLLNEIY